MAKNVFVSFWAQVKSPPLAEVVKAALASFEKTLKG
jgi:hypothetical protein